MLSALRLAAVALVSATHMAGAAVIGVTGNGEIISAPADVSDDAATNTLIQAFDEQQDVFLPSDIEVDGGVIKAGTLVDSHMVFLNSEGNTRVEVGIDEPPVTFTFDGIILGIMSDRGGTFESASSAVLGAISTIYPGAFRARGIEGNSANRSNDWYEVDGDTLSLGLRVTEPGDWLRVVTAAAPGNEPPSVPLPASALLLAAAVVGLRLQRR